MRAAWYSKNGDVRDVLVVGELPTPEPVADEVRVKLATSGVTSTPIFPCRSGRSYGTRSTFMSFWLAGLPRPIVARTSTVFTGC